MNYDLLVRINIKLLDFIYENKNLIRSCNHIYDWERDLYDIELNYKNSVFFTFEGEFRSNDLFIFKLGKQYDGENIEKECLNFINKFSNDEKIKFEGLEEIINKN